MKNINIKDPKSVLEALKKIEDRGERILFKRQIDKAIEKLPENEKNEAKDNLRIFVRDLIQETDDLLHEVDTQINRLVT